MDGNGGKSAVGVDPPVHYPQLQQEAMQGASAPPPPYAPMVQQPLPIQQTVVVLANESFGPYPNHMQCPNCQQNITTKTRHESGALSWLLCCVLCFVGCDCGCCLIPFCVDGAQDVMHDCPNCKTFLGAYKRLNC